MAPKSKLREIREEEGLYVTDLAKIADVSPKTIERVEAGKKAVSTVTKSKIVKGLNKHPNVSRKYKYLEVFPKDGKRST